MVSMRKLVLTGVAAGGLELARRFLRGRMKARRGPSEWFAVTVALDSGELSGPDRPPELAWLAERHEVRVRPAPGGRGSEIALRRPSGRDRELLRGLKQRLETGEALRGEGQPEGRASGRSRAGGRLSGRAGRPALAPRAVFRA